MNDKRLVLPEQKGYELAYELAYKLAGEQLARIDDIKQQCEKADARYQEAGGKKTIAIQYLGQPYLITLPDLVISPQDSAEPLSMKEKVLILHYFLTARGTPLSNKLIAFSELPEGSVYSPTFSQRTIRLLVNQFGHEPHLLVTASEKLGGYPANYGATAVTINAFSRVPITFILWHDDEFPPMGNIVFNATINDYLPTEDITILCETITWRLIKYPK